MYKENSWVQIYVGPGPLNVYIFVCVRLIILNWLTIRGAGGFSCSSVSHQQKLNTNTQQCLFVSIMSSVGAAEREMHRGEDEDDERRRQRKLEEALEAKSLRRIISAYLKCLFLSLNS